MLDHSARVSHPLILALLLLLAAWLLFGLALLAAGRRGDARALAGFIPDCVVLFKRLAGDPRVPRRRKLVPALVLGYLLMPFDLIPDFIPGLGQLDDALLVALALRYLTRGGGEAAVREHWPGPQASLDVLLRVAG